MAFPDGSIKAGNGLIQVPWTQWIGRTGQEGVDGRMGYGGGCAVTMTIMVKEADLIDAVAQLVGSAYFNKDQKCINRVVPPAHPVFTWLYCSEISSMRPVK